MRTKVGEVEALFRYPVKSMSGETLEDAELGWHGLQGDRRLALRRLDDQRGFPWLTASKLPELIRFKPVRRGTSDHESLPTHVRTPEGEELELFGQELAARVSDRHGSPVEMTHLDRGIFDEASVSLITSATVAKLTKLAGQSPDTRRFRPNILISLQESQPFGEDAWVGGLLSFGEEDAAVIAITNWDVRCSMVNFDPDSGAVNPEVLKAVVRERNNKAGVYGAVMRRGRLAVGQSIYLKPLENQKPE
ncbi:MAG: MOSC domain-containing protein [Candidatus Eisenbacteria bacterium]|uniref:MOSC domain-containing protein n=1 Tax=Eiseniibacteriota bacterium TaxID=2212470 RepID=A0A7Y2EB05_UNCEI|nr:MOSC domain-containing protein [Candidatus Eisenbacteria bacterium]